MSLFIDTSVWSLALRRDRPPDVLEVGALERALAGGDLQMKRLRRSGQDLDDIRTLEEDGDGEA